MDEERITKLAILYEKYIIDPAYFNIERAVISLGKRWLTLKKLFY